MLVLASHRRLHRASALAAASLALALVGARRAGAQAPPLASTVEAFLDQVGGAVMQVMRSDDGTASADMAAARVVLDQLRTLSVDPGARAALGPAARRLVRLVHTTDGALRRAEAAVGNPRVRARRKIQVLKAVYARGMRALAAVGRPVLAEASARTAGFHKPGQDVTFRVLGPDGGLCNEMPTVTVENQYASSAVDLATVVAHPNGTVTMTMGAGAGGARVTVTACGQTSSRLVFNYGPRTSGGGHGIPRDLPEGLYALSVAASGYVTIPETPLGTLANTDAQSFATALRDAFRQAVAGYDAPGCATSTRYSRFDGESFSIRFRVTCSTVAVTLSETLIFRVRKL
jgi:hypothetical protein